LRADDRRWRVCHIGQEFVGCGAHTVIVNRRNGAVLRQLQTLFNIGTIGDLTDGQLLERFATDASEIAELAFAALVERHQTMVWRACLAILRDEHLAEDAVQATFLVLVRKARSLWVRDSLGPWLHQVACRTASCLRATVMRRRKLEQRWAKRNGVSLAEVETERYADRDALVHEELNRLPEKYRAPVVLCDLEGRTHHEAARFLGLPIGTVKSRQSQGRRLLRDRLVRRGLGFAVAEVVVESMRQRAAAAIPKELLPSIVTAAMRQSARVLTSCGASSAVLSLTQGVVQAMLWTRIQHVAVATLAVAIASGGASVFVRGSQEARAEDGQVVTKRQAAETEQSTQPSSPKNSAGSTADAERQQRLRAQQLATRKAKALYEMAKLKREIAEINVEEYQDTGYAQDLAAAEGEIKLAEVELTRAKDRVDWAKRMFEKGYVSLSQKVSEELGTHRAEFAQDQAATKKKVLVEFTKDKKIKELKSEVAKAESDELARQATWELEIAKEKKLERELKAKTK
jgi:HlyD family secretion protein